MYPKPEPNKPNLHNHPAICNDLLYRYIGEFVEQQMLPNNYKARLLYAIDRAAFDVPYRTSFIRTLHAMYLWEFRGVNIDGDTPISEEEMWELPGRMDPHPERPLVAAPYIID